MTQIEPHLIELPPDHRMRNHTPCNVLYVDDTGEMFCCDTACDFVEIPGLWDDDQPDAVNTYCREHAPINERKIYKVSTDWNISNV